MMEIMMLLIITITINITIIITIVIIMDDHNHLTRGPLSPQASLYKIMMMMLISTFTTSATIYYHHADHLTRVPAPLRPPSANH